MHLSQSDYPPTFAAYAWLVDRHLLPLPIPDMVRLEPGQFRMGSEPGEGGDPDEQPAHAVQVAAPFWLGRYEVTFAEYDLFAAATGRDKPDDAGFGRGRRPVINVTWHDATAYAAWLARRTGQGWRLPSEAEWEYAARAGTATARWWEQTPGASASPCRFANGQDRTLDESDYLNETVYKNAGLWAPWDCADGYANTAPVGQFAPNPWGLYDMLGNVWEWVADCAYAYPAADGSGMPRDAGPVSDATEGFSKYCAIRGLRGGAWSNQPRDLRAAYRSRLTPDDRNDDLGLRLARSD